MRYDRVAQVPHVEGRTPNAVRGAEGTPPARSGHLRMTSTELTPGGVDPALPAPATPDSAGPSWAGGHDG